MEGYFDHFNNARFGKVARYFADDMELRYFRRWTTGPQEPLVVIKGRDGFLSNYEYMNGIFDEKIRLLGFAANEGSLFVDIRTSWVAKKDTDIMVIGPLRKGEMFCVNHFINYTLDLNGKFMLIRVAQFRTIDPNEATVR